MRQNNPPENYEYIFQDIVRLIHNLSNEERALIFDKLKRYCCQYCGKKSNNDIWQNCDCAMNK